ncbi:MAG: Cof-type HAD-IIB family hydrolase [Bacilli bacterium]|nr:Cof-type HAD-IIB family hydrolase [Bacilli bacterium]
MNYKLISMDFDGTLLTSEKIITQNTKRVLEILKNNGYYIVGVTGRNINSAKSVCDLKMFNYLILNNGAFIYDVKKDNAENIGGLDEKLQKEIFNHFKDKSYAIDFCSYDKYFMYRKVIDESKKFLVKINDLNDINEPICRINIFADDSLIDEYYTYLINKYSDKANIFIMKDSDDASNLRWIAIIPKNINKGIAIEKLCNKLNIKLDECMFFADGPNDIEALDIVGLGIAMDNAFEEVKRYADDITLSNDKEGIAVYLRNKFNIKI